MLLARLSIFCRFLLEHMHKKGRPEGKITLVNNKNTSYNAVNADQTWICPAIFGRHFDRV
jgi:hypothetical protein